MVGMNSKFLLIGSLSVLAAIGLFFASVSTNEGKSLESDDSHAIDKITEEMNSLQTMTCAEIIQRNSQGEYLNSDNREFARDTVGDCSDKQELPYHVLHYSSVLISAQTPQEFYTEDAYSNLLTGIYSNVVKENNFQLSDALLQYQIDFCKLYTEKFDEEIKACDNIQITTQPYKPAKTIEEFYDIIYQNELDIINNTECSELHDAYDGKMHTISWGPHEDMIGNALNKCKGVDDTALKVINQPTNPNKVIKSIALENIPYQKLIENEQEYVGHMLHYSGKISNVDNNSFTDSTAEIAVTPGAGWVDPIELIYNDLKLKNESFKEVWGTYLGINEDTSLPMLQVFIIE